MDRIHRLGQHRPVKAIKIVVEDSIESRIIQLQEKKMAMVDATLSADDKAMGRLTPEDVSSLLSILIPTNSPVKSSWASCLDFDGLPPTFLASLRWRHPQIYGWVSGSFLS
jgi:hypothetical protein